MMTPSQIANVRETFQFIAPQGDEMAEVFFERLFTREPFLRKVLPQDHWIRSRDLLTGMGLLVKNLHRLDAIEHVLTEFGAKAQRAGVSPHHYGLARQAMLATLREFAAETWNDDVESDWTEAFNAASSVVLLGAGRARAKAA